METLWNTLCNKHKWSKLVPTESSSLSSSNADSKPATIGWKATIVVSVPKTDTVQYPTLFKMLETGLSSYLNDSVSNSIYHSWYSWVCQSSSDKGDVTISIFNKDGEQVKRFVNDASHPEWILKAIESRYMKERNDCMYLLFEKLSRYFKHSKQTKPLQMYFSRDIEQTLKDQNGRGPLVVVYYMEGCGYCTRLASILENAVINSQQPHLMADIPWVFVSRSNCDPTYIKTMYQTGVIEGFPTFYLYQDNAILGQKLLRFNNEWIKPVEYAINASCKARECTIDYDEPQSSLGDSDIQPRLILPLTK